MVKNAVKGTRASGSREIRALIAASERGAGEAAVELGYRYREGLGVAKDLSASMHWYLVGAELGNADAQNDYGSMWFNGCGCTRDPQAAATWYKMSAEQGHPVAQFNLAVCYLNGDGAPLDTTQAAVWLEKAAEQRHPDAQYELALCYLRGNGAPIDPAKAAAWLQKAARQGQLKALGEFGTLLRFGTGVEQNFVAAADFHVIAALEGDLPSMGNLADYYEEIEQAGWQGNQTACLALGKMYDKGLGVEANRARALAWLRWGRKQAVRLEGCDEELGEFLSFMELAAKIDDDVAAGAKKMYADWVKQYKRRPARNRKRDGKGE